MTQEDLKPLNWTPAPGIGYSVVRRPDGGMHYTFTDVTRETLDHWREFALEHLLESDRLTRNLYDLRSVEEITIEAVDYAIEVNSDPSARNIRLAVVVANDAVRDAIEKIPSLTTAGGVEFRIFTEIDEAEEWLDRPLTLIV
jgi:MFS superfamily sulfate permease-like transporter